jgi:hypothetical protein
LTNARHFFHKRTIGFVMKAKNGWSVARRAKQAAAIHRWRPWTKSTGPRTVEGKATSAGNAAKPDSIRKELLAMKAELAQVLRLAKKLDAARRRSRRQL